ncbi:hypothetical protein [Clostridium ljungdahlii]|uniref:hypothetical protein n=1 Tax=Clostridium ljungdahlii TaxID=1538 RepID=UPI00386C34EC
MKSILIKPIFFREKWQAGLGYGLPAILYFLLFVLMVNSEYALSQIDIKNQYPMSGKTQVAVSGTVTPSNPSSSQQTSLYSFGTISSSVNFQMDLLTCRMILFQYRMILILYKAILDKAVLIQFILIALTVKINCM